MNAPPLKPPQIPKTPVAKMSQPRLRSVKRLLTKPQGGMKPFGR